MITELEKNKENNFNLLRLLFASLVILSHVSELQFGNRSHELLYLLFKTISFGDLAIDCFFILSGFLIVKSWLERPQIIPFLLSRILRIYPAFFLSAIICTFIIGPLYSEIDYFTNFSCEDFIWGLINLNLIIFTDIFPNTHYTIVNGSLWTIPYEFKCYLFVLILGSTIGFNKKFIFPTIFIICSLIYIAFFIKIIQIPIQTLIYVRFLMAFTAGGSFYLYQEQISWNRKFALLGFLFFIFTLFFRFLAELGICLFLSYSLIYYAKYGTKFLSFNRLPDVSYGVYLYAWPITKIILWYFPNMSLVLLTLLVFVFSVFSGMLSWYIIEQPFIKIKAKFYKKIS